MTIVMNMQWPGLTKDQYDQTLTLVDWEPAIRLRWKSDTGRFERF